VLLVWALCVPCAASQTLPHDTSTRVAVPGCPVDLVLPLATDVALLRCRAVARGTSHLPVAPAAAVCDLSCASDAQRDTHAAVCVIDADGAHWEGTVGACVPEHGHRLSLPLATAIGLIVSGLAAVIGLAFGPILRKGPSVVLECVVWSGGGVFAFCSARERAHTRCPSVCFCFFGCVAPGW